MAHGEAGYLPRAKPGGGRSSTRPLGAKASVVAWRPSRPSWRKRMPQTRYPCGLEPATVSRMFAHSGRADRSRSLARAVLEAGSNPFLKPRKPT